ncbi:MAG: hypothetical protein IT462_16815 [Planctomycetes bacterium]|nr:hypothetical protein [Planctomycetota bacterium]
MPTTARQNRILYLKAYEGPHAFEDKPNADEFDLGIVVCNFGSTRVGAEFSLQVIEEGGLITVVWDHEKRLGANIPSYMKDDGSAGARVRLRRRLVTIVLTEHLQKKIVRLPVDLSVTDPQESYTFVLEQEKIWYYLFVPNETPQLKVVELVREDVK